MAILGALLGAIATTFLLSWFLASFCMWAGAKVAGVPGIGLGRAWLTALSCSFLAWTCTLVFSLLPIVGTFLGAAMGIVLSLFLIMRMMSATFGQAFVVWVFNGAAHLIAIVIAVLTFGATIVAALVHLVDQIARTL